MNGPVLRFGASLPGGDTTLEGVQMPDAGIAQTFARDQAGLHLGDVEPTRMLRRVVYLTSPPEALRRKSSLILVEYGLSPGPRFRSTQSAARGSVTVPRRQPGGGAAGGEGDEGLPSLLLPTAQYGGCMVALMAPPRSTSAAPAVPEPLQTVSWESPNEPKGIVA
jgi:hypothetical protein